MLETNAEHIEH